MLVTHFNSFLRGGASTAAQLLHRGLLDQGIPSRFQYLSGQDIQNVEGNSNGFVETRWRPSGVIKNTGQSVGFRLHRERFKHATGKISPDAEVFTSHRGRPHTAWPPIGHPAEQTGTRQHIVNLHWISKFIDQTSFFRSLPDNLPVVWTLHDMNALTGGCHFAGGCNAFQSGCGNCPQLKLSGDRDASRLAFEIKQQILRNINLNIVAPSRWLLDQARRSPILGHARSFRLIPYGMPTNTLRPVDSHAARQRLGFAEDDFLVAFGAMNLNSRRKGGQELMAALQQLRGVENLKCLVFGGGALPEERGELPPMVHVGHVSDAAVRRSVYSAANVFVLPSLEDNLPLTGLEAMACGTPVIGFDTGGIPDYVLPNRTGWLARHGDPNDLAQQIKYAAALSPEQRQRIGDNARRLMQREFDVKSQAKNYIELYQSLIQTDAQPLRRAA